MRVSADSDDPGYGQLRTARAAGKVPLVYLDGVIVTHVITADSDKGFVRAYVVDAEGHPTLDASGEEVAIYAKAGHVCIEFKDEGKEGAADKAKSR